MKRFLIFCEFLKNHEECVFLLILEIEISRVKLIQYIIFRALFFGAMVFGTMEHRFILR